MFHAALFVAKIDDKPDGVDFSSWFIQLNRATISCDLVSLWRQSARLWYLQCIRTWDTSVLHLAIIFDSELC